MLAISWDNPKLQELQEWFNSQLPDALYSTHYQLAEQHGDSTPQEWNEFLTHPIVSDYINSELRMLQQNTLRQLIRDMSTTVRSPGTGQAINALSKLLETSGVKDGPVFIYSYVPLSEEELKAPNVRVESTDVFKS